MTKRITALLIAVAVPMALLFTGCGKQLTEREYYDDLYAYFNEYVEALNEIETVRANVTSSQEIMLEQTKASEICEKAEKALDKFEKMNPPDGFAEKHKTLLAAVELEKKFVSASEKVLTAKTPFELDKFSGEAAMIFAGVPEDRQFAPVLAGLLSDLKAADN